MFEVKFNEKTISLDEGYLVVVKNRFGYKYVGWVLLSEYENEIKLINCSPIENNMDIDYIYINIIEEINILSRGEL